MRRIVSGIMLGLIVASATGCMSWRIDPTPATVLLAGKPLQTLRVMTVDSIPVVLHQPRIVGDSITGHPTANAVERRTINLKDVASVATKHLNFGKTLAAGAAIVGGVLVYGWLQSLNGTTP
ncbi:MAG: hypothetical protein ACKVZ0_12760 [Gemmatimonadales bacterium]